MAEQIENRVREEIKELVKNRICYDERTGRATTWCVYYGENGCPKSCCYSRNKNRRSLKERFINLFYGSGKI